MLKNTNLNIMVLVLCALLCASCNNGDYTNALPRNCIAIIESPANALGIDIEGIDTTKNTYYFEMADGTLGLCAPVDEEVKVDEYLHHQNTEGTTDNFTEYNGIQFCTMEGKWVVGYNNTSLLIMGPIIPSERSKTVRRISQLMNQEEERSVKNAEIWKHLQENTTENNSTAKMAITISALPEQMMSALSLGMPRGATPEEIILEGGITLTGNTMEMNGHMCSYDSNTKQQLQENQKTIFRPLTNISPDAETTSADSSLISIFMNIDGNTFMPHLHDNKQLNTMLLGTEAYEKLKQTNGNVGIMIDASNVSGESKYKVNVKDIVNQDNKPKEPVRLIVTLNVDMLKQTIGNTIVPLPQKVNRIICSLKE